ncbi:RNA polymerase sigma factor, sigma-70 family [Synechococcus sp. PCC 7502]|uniref:sigma-70 family RNA polymerase sigma factor n=1 Tax=Synechococcus sp. PCC 7502 TaxID=1173263 RepID=UPI00029FF4DE|nr:sigma-70 family RNA polymerase sigma factor [Synechococcus sp. PCC 7502]AFY74420.1 RNA polymerase sigma factor, sigma-70 family [Synechococcus sp. PCC 7502]
MESYSALKTEQLNAAKVREFSAEDKQQTLEILKAYRLAPCARLRNQLVQLNIGLVKKEVGYWLRQSSEGYEDLLQVGCMGLIGAIERFEISKGYAFSSFATRYVRGEIQHYLRDKCSTLRVPRRCLELYHQATRKASELRFQLDREPSEAEVANALGVTAIEWQEIKLANRNRSLLSLDAPMLSLEEGSVTLSDLVPDPKQNSTVQAEDITPLYQALNILEQRTRKILEYVFLEDITQREVAKLLGISTVTVSRQVKKGLSTLRSNLALQQAA